MQRGALNRIGGFRILALFFATLLSCAGTAKRGYVSLSEEQRQWLAEHPVIRVAPDPDFPPIEFFDKEGSFRGIAADILGLVEERLGIRFKIIRCANWDEVLRKVQHGEVDLLSAAARTPHREEYLLFSSPHISLPGVIITRKGGPKSLTLLSMKGLRLSVVSGYLWQEYVNRDYPEITIDAVPDVKTGLRKVGFGLSDAMVENVATALQTIENEGISNLMVAGESGYHSDLCFAVRKDWPELNAILDATLKEIGPQAREKIRNSWIRLDQPLSGLSRGVLTAFFIICVAATVIIILSIAWNHSLSNQVAQRTSELEQQLSERKKAEEALRESENKFITMVENANSIILRMDKEGKITFFNDFAVSFFGYTKEEITGKPVVGTIVPLHDSSGQELSAKILDIGLHPDQYTSTENENICKDGRRVWVAWSNKPIRDKSGAVSELLCVGNDITKLKRVEAALKQERDLVTAVFETAGALQVVTDPEGRIVRFNRTCEEATGYRRQEVVGRYFWEFLLLPSEADRVRDLFYSVRGGNFPNQGENDWVGKDGKQRLISWYNTAILDDQGDVEYVVSTGIDITELRRADAELRKHRDHLEEMVQARTVELSRAVAQLEAEVAERRRAEDALRESERRYRFLFEESPSGNIIVHPDGTVRDVNVHFAKNLGYTKEDLVGKSALSFIHPDDRERVKNALFRRSQDEPIPERDNAVLSKDGSIHYIVFSSNQTMLYDTGALTGMLITGTDVTERRRAEMLARRQQEQLMQADKMSSLGILVSGVAHEINNPNNFILLNSENLRDIWRDLLPILDSRVRERGEFMAAGLPFGEIRNETDKLIAGIGEGAQRIKKIVDSLKDFARQDSGEMNQAVDINNVIESAVIILANLIKKSTNRFCLEYEKELPIVQGNKQQIEQVVINLMANACQALTCTSQQVTVRTGCVPGQGTVSIEVTDEGRGISPENLKHIMDPFFTTKRDCGGTGLGLAISYGIVKNHRGELHIESYLGKGTSAKVVLPCEPVVTS